MHINVYCNLCLIYFMSFLELIRCKKPYSKRQQAIWRLECDLGIINDSDCPVHGGWTPWSAWSPCIGPCDNIGHRKRTRKCVNPTPANDGLPCSGLEEELETCQLTNCTVEDFKKLIEGDTTRNEALRQLETVPALMERCLQMECPFEAIEAGLATDNTWQLNPEALWNSLQCVKHNIGCPVIGEWGTWEKWSACGARCGRGLRWRLRRCDTPPPSDGHLICTGVPLQAEECEGDQCAIDEFAQELGVWSDWGAWSICSEKCGQGVRRRRRICREEYTPQSSGIWGTHCRGQHDQLQICGNEKCVLEGGWSGWSTWGPCSQTCGAGRRSRTRSCTRPIPSGSGANCVGPRTEVGPCHLTPCEVYVHTVAVLNGDSFLQYNFDNKRSTLFHFYIRFKPLSPTGTLVRRGTVHSPQVRLILQKWQLCLDAGGTSTLCVLPRMCTPSVLEPAAWHSALITVTSESASLRLNDAPEPIRSTFSCDPELLEEKMNIIIGEKLHGEIQEIVLNFIPLKLVSNTERRSTASDFYPYSTSNIAYEKAEMDEAYLNIDSDQYLRLPCFESFDEWCLKLTLKPKREDGTILFLGHENSDTWLLMTLQNMRLKLKLALGEFRSESVSTTEYYPDQWLDVTLSKKRQCNTIEASINAGERLHVLLEEESTRKRRESYNFNHNSKSSNTSILAAAISYSEDVVDHANKKCLRHIICNNEFYVGGIPAEIKNKINEDVTSLYGSIASVSINRILKDLHDFSMERYKDNKVQVSSRTASVSGSYHETVWGKSNRLNLTCLHARTMRSPHDAHWLYLDTTISGVLKDKSVRSVDDGRVLRLVASADNDLRGFYTCRAYGTKRTRNVITYGVVGKVQYQLSGPDTTTIVAVLTTLILVIGTLTWLIIEGVNDIQNGYGFFRDGHFTPQEEAEAVCRYIDQNMHLIGSKSAAKVAKAKARRIGRQLASRSSFAAQEPEGLMEAENLEIEESSPSEPEGLPALPEIKSLEESHDIYRCEPCYVSSPRHGSNVTSPRTKLTSSSSFEMTSPRVLCSRLLLAKRIYSSRESLLARNRKARGGTAAKPHKTRSKLLTIKSSTYINLSPAQKILQRFQQLKSEDT